MEGNMPGEEVYELRGGLVMEGTVDSVKDLGLVSWYGEPVEGWGVVGGETWMKCCSSGCELVLQPRTEVCGARTVLMTWLIRTELL